MKLFLSKKRSFEKEESFADRLQTEVNTWLQENPGIEAAAIRQSTASGSFESVTFAASIWYEEASGVRDV